MFRFSTYEVQAKLSQETNFNTQFKESKEDLTGWINKLEGILLGEPVQINYPKVLTNQLEQLKVKFKIFYKNIFLTLCIFKYQRNCKNR